MTKQDQHLIVTEILDSLRETLMANIDRVPANWDGFELRAWVADMAAERYAYALRGKRLKNYTNARITENL